MLCQLAPPRAHRRSRASDSTSSMIEPSHTTQLPPPPATHSHSSHRQAPLSTTSTSNHLPPMLVLPQRFILRARFNPCPSILSLPRSIALPSPPAPLRLKPHNQSPTEGVAQTKRRPIEKNDTSLAASPNGSGAARQTKCACAYSWVLVHPRTAPSARQCQNAIACAQRALSFAAHPLRPRAELSCMCCCSGGP